MRYWSEHSIFKSKFTPIVESANLGNGLPVQTYYISHPPFSFYFLYFIEKTTCSNHFFLCNLLLVLISGIFIYLTIALLTVQHAKRNYTIYGFIGLILYTTHPSVLKYQLLNYHPDIFVQSLLIISNYILVKVMMKERYHSPKYLILFSIVMFLMNYSSWFGVIYSSIILLIGLFNLRRGYKFIPYILLTAVIVFATLLLTYSQYAYIGGWKNVIYYFKDTYLRESLLGGDIGHTSWSIFRHILKNIGNFVILIGVLIIVAIIKRRRKFAFTKNGYRFVFISIVPILLYSIVFIKYFQNAYMSLYFIPALTVIIAVWLEKMYKNYDNNRELLKLAFSIVISNLTLFVLFHR